MSAYLGFQPTDQPDYFFLSYNCEDQARIGELAGNLSFSGVPVWYDYGIPYNEKWEEIISSRIADAAGVLLFFTRGILLKKESYVQKEYRIAKLLKKAITVILLDEIHETEIPPERAAFWVDIQERQCVPAFHLPLDKQCLEIMRAIGMETYQDRMNQLIVRYRELFIAGRTQDAERFLSNYMHGMTLQGKASVIANAVSAGILTPAQTGEACRPTLPEPSLTDLSGKACPYLSESRQLAIAGTCFTAGTSEFLSHYGPDYCPFRVYLWRGRELLICFPILEAELAVTYYDRCSDTLYLCYRHQSAEKPQTHRICYGVCIVEHPLGEVALTNFKEALQIDEQT